MKFTIFCSALSSKEYLYICFLYPCSDKNLQGISFSQQTVVSKIIKKKRMGRIWNAPCIINQHTHAQGVWISRFISAAQLVFLYLYCKILHDVAKFFDIFQFACLESSEKLFLPVQINVIFI